MENPQGQSQSLYILVEATGVTKEILCYVLDFSKTLWKGELTDCRIVVGTNDKNDKRRRKKLKSHQTSLSMISQESLPTVTVKSDKSITNQLEGSVASDQDGDKSMESAITNNSEGPVTSSQDCSMSEAGEPYRKRNSHQSWCIMLF